MDNDVLLLIANELQEINMKNKKFQDYYELHHCRICHNEFDHDCECDQGGKSYNELYMREFCENDECSSYICHKCSCGSYCDICNKFTIYCNDCINHCTFCLKNYCNTCIHKHIDVKI